MSISLRRLAALCRKESYQIVRDPSSILIAFVLPVLLLFIYGYGINLDANRVRLGIVQQDGGVEASRFVQTLQASPFIAASLSTSESAMRQQLQMGEVRGVVILRSDFSARVRQGQGAAAIQLLTDGAEPNTANFVASYVQGVFQLWLNQRQGGQPAAATLTVQPRYWFNPTTVSRNYLVPGSISVIMTIIGALLTSLVVAREWERGTMEALLSTPVTRAELLLSKIIPYYLLGMAAMAMCVLVATLVMGVPLRGSLWVLFVVTSLFLGSALGLGLLLSTTTRNQFIAAQFALTAAFLPAIMLSGFVFEIRSMPLAVQAVTYLIPARYFVSALQTLFQAGEIWPVLLINLLFLLLSAAFWLGLTAWRTPRRLDGN
ncbi:ABC transporter permease [Aquitalea sp. LB_tupeE]|uniref:ABC transporter permease n=1 Tax=Aquitalea sp. LB_tupeE TaxID=2748078 RepID=UPI0015B9C1C6|nr:ABC transporter permease [Aquitalea sp. LB_tupeE]NWK77752.1 ABC transporter permease [Aquitalea sp. LB_tupeE]